MGGANPCRGGVLFVLLCVLSAAGCRTTVRADPEEWTVGRAMEVLGRVENLQVQVVRDGGWFSTHGISAYAVDDDEIPAGTLGCDEGGFDDFHLLPPGPDSHTTGEEVEQALFEVFFTGLTGVEISESVEERERKSHHYGVTRIRFADIRRVVIARKGYPLLGLLLVIGPWYYDVELEMKDGGVLTVYRWAGDWLNLFPFWLYPAEWLHTIEAEEYAQAIEFLRARAEDPGR